MPKPYLYLRMAVQGTIDSAQSWSVGLSINPNGAAYSQSVLTAYAAALAPSLTTFFTGFAPYCDSGTVVNDITVYQYDAGAPSAGVQGRFNYVTKPVGSSSTKLDSRMSMVASLLSATSGRAGRGRIYLPGAGVAMTNRQFSAGPVGAIAPLVAAWIRAINLVNIGSTSPGTVCIAGASALMPVTTVRIDSKVDTQRRRSDKLPATSQVSTTV